MKEQAIPEYVIAKRVQYYDDYTMIFCFLGKFRDEEYDQYNPFHRKFTIGWKFQPAFVKAKLAIQNVDELIIEFKVAYKLVNEDKLEQIKEFVNGTDVKEITDFMDNHIDVSLYSCINVGSYK